MLRSLYKGRQERGSHNRVEPRPLVALLGAQLATCDAGARRRRRGSGNGNGNGTAEGEGAAKGEEDQEEEGEDEEGLSLFSGIIPVTQTHHIWVLCWRKLFSQSGRNQCSGDPCHAS